MHTHKGTHTDKGKHTGSYLLCRRFGAGLTARGFKRGDVFALYTRNTIEWFCVFHGGKTLCLSCTHDTRIHTHSFTHSFFYMLIRIHTHETRFFTYTHSDPHSDTHSFLIHTHSDTFSFCYTLILLHTHSDTHSFGYTLIRVHTF
jgi:hypothetical protein